MPNTVYRWLGFSLLAISCFVTAVIASVLLKPNWYLNAADFALKHHNGTRLYTERVSAKPSEGRWQISGLGLHNPRWPDTRILELSEAEFSITATPWPWRWGKQGFWQLHLSGLTLRLEENEWGERNWPSRNQTPGGAIPSSVDSMQGPNSKAQTTPKLPGYFGLHALQLEQLEIQQKSPAQTQTLLLPSLLVQREDAHSLSIKAKPIINGEAFELNGEALFAAANTTENSAGNTAKNTAEENQASDALQLQLQLDHPLLSLQSGGQFLLQAGWTGSQMRLELALADIPGLAKLLQQPLAISEGLRQAKLSGELRIAQTWQLNALELQIGDQRIQGKAQYQLPEGDTPAQLKLSLSSKQLQLDTLLPPQINSEADAAAKAQPLPSDIKQQLAQWLGPQTHIALAIDSLGYEDWQLQDLKTQLDLRPAQEQQTAKLDVTLSAASAKNKQRAEARLADLDAQLTLQASKAKDALIDIQAEAGYPGFKLELATSLNHALFESGAIRRGNHLSLKAHGGRLEALWPLLGQDWSAPGPIALNLLAHSGNSSAKASAELSMNSHHMNSHNDEDAEASLQLDYKLAGGGLGIDHWNINLDAANLDLRFLAATQEAAKAESQSGQDTDTPTSDTELFSNTPLPLEPLRSNSLMGSIKLSNIQLPDMLLNTLSAKPRLKDAVFSIAGFHAELGEGSIDANMLIDAAASPVKVRASMSVDQLSADALGLHKSAQLSGGQLRAHMMLNSQGDSAKALADNSEGELMLRLQDMLLQNGQVNMLGSDLILETLQQLNPFAKSDKTTPLECVDLRFTGKEGRFDSIDPLLVETNKMRILGRGHIDLREETLKFGFTPVAKQGIGVNIGSVAQAVGIAGPILSPKPVADAEGLLKTTLSAGAAISTGGISLLAEGIFRRATSGPSPCADTK